MILCPLCAAVPWEHYPSRADPWLRCSCNSLRFKTRSSQWRFGLHGAVVLVLVPGPRLFRYGDSEPTPASPGDVLQALREAVAQEVLES